jgi:hypothetical protein
MKFVFRSYFPIFVTIHTAGFTRYQARLVKFKDSVAKIKNKFSKNITVILYFKIINSIFVVSIIKYCYVYSIFIDSKKQTYIIL